MSILVVSIDGRAAAPTEPQPAESSTERVRRIAGEVKLDVERLRGLTFVSPVEVRVIDDAEARRHVIRRLDEFAPPDRLRRYQQAVTLLGLLPRGTDIREAVLEAMEQHAGGFYDPGAKAYYVLSDVPQALLPVVTAHELTHALEDQHYDLDGRLRAVLADDDAVFALSAVVEGSATLLMSRYAEQAARESSLDPAVLRSLADQQALWEGGIDGFPPLLERLLIAPYALGPGFLRHGAAAGPDATYPAGNVERAYRAAPRSSEQVLHPEKYWDAALRDEPRPVDLGGVGRRLGESWRLEAGGVLGELVIALLADPVHSGTSPTRWTHEAAAGWGGDRWELWADPPRYAVLALTVWDTPRDAAEFAVALERRENLRFEREGVRVAIVAGEVGRKARHLLRGLLGAKLVSPDGTR